MNDVGIPLLFARYVDACMFRVNISSSKISKMQLTRSVMHWSFNGCLNFETTISRVTTVNSNQSCGLSMCHIILFAYKVVCHLWLSLYNVDCCTPNFVFFTYLLSSGIAFKIMELHATCNVIQGRGWANNYTRFNQP